MPSRVSAVVKRARRTDRECALVPVATLVVGQITRRELARVIHVLVRMAMFLRSVGVGMAVVGVRVRCRSGGRAAKIERRDGLLLGHGAKERRRGTVRGCRSRCAAEGEGVGVVRPEDVDGAEPRGRREEQRWTSATDGQRYRTRREISSENRKTAPAACAAPLSRCTREHAESGFTAHRSPLTIVRRQHRTA